MGILNDYKCPAHGYFESTKAVCPHGCTDVQVVFLQPVGMIGDRTKGSDKTLNQLALDFKMGDIKSVKEGEAQPPRFAKETPQNPFAPRWGNAGDLGGFQSLERDLGRVVQKLGILDLAGESIHVELPERPGKHVHITGTKRPQDR